MYVLTDEQKIADKITEYFPGVTIFVQGHPVKFVCLDEDAKKVDVVVMVRAQGMPYYGYFREMEFWTLGKGIPFIKIDYKTLKDDCPSWIDELRVIANKLEQEYVNRQTDKILDMED